MLTPEQKLNFIINNSRLEGMECDEKEIARLKNVLSREISTEQAVEEILEKYKNGKNLSE